MVKERLRSPFKIPWLWIAKLNFTLASNAQLLLVFVSYTSIYDLEEILKANFADIDVLTFMYYIILQARVNVACVSQRTILKDLTKSDYTFTPDIQVSLTFKLKGIGQVQHHPPTFSKKVGIFIPSEVLAWVMTACRVLRSRLTYFWRYMNISCIFYLSKSTSINTQYSSLWDTLKMLLFTKYLIKWKRIVRISWNFWY